MTYCTSEEVQWLKLRKNLQLLQKIAKFFSTWPLNDRASYKKVLLEKIAWNFFLVNYIMCLIPNSLLLHHMAINYSIPLSLYFQWISLVDVIFVMTICRFQRSRLQVYKLS